MEELNRREFIQKAARYAVLCPVLGVLGCDALFSRDGDNISNSDAASGATPSLDGIEPVEEAMYYTTLEDKSAECSLCFRNCIISKGDRGACRNRENKEGKLYSLVYGRPTAVRAEPIEKEPMHHMLPGSDILCIGTAGCNFRCRHCHNWHMSQRPIEEMDRIYEMSPKEIIRKVKSKNLPAVSFTYNEPTSFYEYMLDISKKARDNGIKILFHSNGAINKEPLEEMLKYTDAATVDLKGFTDEFYRKVFSANLDPVKRSLEIIKKTAWLEIVNLVIPGYNDSAEEIRDMCRWIKSDLGEETPLHFSRFMPSYRLTGVSRTPVDTLERAFSIAVEEGLHYVSIGNVPGHRKNSTFCPKCEERIIHRRHFHVVNNHIKEGNCSFCGHRIPGIWA